MPNDEICNLWQNQTPRPSPLTLADLRRRSGRFRSQVAWRNFREYAVSALLVVYFSDRAWNPGSGGMRAGYLLMAAGLLYMMYQLHRRAASIGTPAEVAWTPCLSHYRAELERQRDVLRAVWKWYLGPLVPGLAVILATAGVTGFRHSVLAGFLALAIAGVIAAVLWWVGDLNRRAAAGIEQQLDALRAHERSA
jgi:hypothetical protein